MSNPVYLSRQYVEFGPLPAEEVLSYFKRGILGDNNYIRDIAAPDWLPVSTWATSMTDSTSTAGTPMAEPPAAPATPVAKKAAAKAAKKAAVKKTVTKA
jgi:hypothetical protein